MITMIVTKITRLIITIIIIIKNIKFTNVIGYHKPNLGFTRTMYASCLLVDYYYWIVYVMCVRAQLSCTLPSYPLFFFLNKMHSFLNFSPLLINL